MHSLTNQRTCKTSQYCSDASRISLHLPAVLQCLPPRLAVTFTLLDLSRHSSNVKHKENSPFRSAPISAPPSSSDLEAPPKLAYTMLHTDMPINVPPRNAGSCRCRGAAKRAWVIAAGFFELKTQKRRNLAITDAPTDHQCCFGPHVEAFHSLYRRSLGTLLLSPP